MTIWTTLGRLIPRNREDKWPLAVQFLVFLLFEGLFIYGKYAASYQVYDPVMYDWATEVFGAAHCETALTVLSILIAMEVCAWHIGLQRYVTFGGHTPRRWTILPIVLGYGALSLTTWLLSQALLTVELPLLTDNLMVYTVAHSVLYVGIVAVFCALIHAFRSKEKGRAGLLTAAEIALVLLLTLCSACSGQIQQNMLAEVYEESAAQPVTVTTFGVPEDAEADDLLSAILGNSGLDMDDVVIVSPGDVQSAVPADPFAAYEEAMKPSNLLADVLQWVQLIPIFFAMKRWLFAIPHTNDK